ncbi:MAG: hypothetical protein IPN94_07730 [Sphingobacteriales bacterium]|nr:hypothetical protein [Sphingobacteriales bacterium]
MAAVQNGTYLTVTDPATLCTQQPPQPSPPHYNEYHHPQYSLFNAI